MYFVLGGFHIGSLLTLLIEHVAPIPTTDNGNTDNRFNLKYLFKFQILKTFETNNRKFLSTN